MSIGSKRDAASGKDRAAAVAAIAALADPTRRALYRYVAAQSAPVGREQAAAAVGVPHHTARFHLDRLRDAGLLEVEYRRPAGRTGPGAGHPTKLYRVTTDEFAVSVPDRRYDIAGAVLTRAVAAAIQDGTPVGQALEEAAAAAGRAIGSETRPAGADVSEAGSSGSEPSEARPGGAGPSGSEPSEAGPGGAGPGGAGAGGAESGWRPAGLAAAVDILDACGFAPRSEGSGYLLGNCPFRALAQEEPDVACRMNLALIRGLLDQLGAPSATAQFNPAEGRCCVRVRS